MERVPIEFQSMLSERDVGGGWKEEATSFLRGSFALCPRVMEKKGRRWGGTGSKIYFPLPLLEILVGSRIGGHPSVHRSIARERGREGQVVRFILPRILRSSVAPYRVFDISLPYPVGTPCGKTYSWIDRPLGENRTRSSIPVHAYYPRP